MSSRVTPSLGETHLCVILFELHVCYDGLCCIIILGLKLIAACLVACDLHLIACHLHMSGFVWLSVQCEVNVHIDAGHGSTHVVVSAAAHDMLKAAVAPKPVLTSMSRFGHQPGCITHNEFK